MLYKVAGVVIEVLKVGLWVIMVVDMGLLSLRVEVASVMLYLGDPRQRPLMQLLQVSSHLTTDLL